jgi:hypothetical protein
VGRRDDIEVVGFAPQQQVADNSPDEIRIPPGVAKPPDDVQPW